MKYNYKMDKRHPKIVEKDNGKMDYPLPKGVLMKDKVKLDYPKPKGYK